MKVPTPLLFALPLLALLGMVGRARPADASTVAVLAWPDSVDVTHFYADSLWADAAAVDSAQAYRDSLRQAQGSAEALINDPLSSAGSGTAFSYSTSYTIGQSNTSWNNTSSYSLRASRFVLTNGTDITLDRYLAGGTTSPRQTRNSQTELAYRFSPELSFGSRANLYRFLSTASGLAAADRDDKDEYQFSARAKARPSRFARTEFNAFGGYLNNDRPTYSKRGLSGDANGSVNLSAAWLANLVVQGQATGNLTRATLSETSSEKANTRDGARILRATLGVLPGRKLGLNLNASRRLVTTQSPVAATVESLSVLEGEPAQIQFPGQQTTHIQELQTRSGDVSAALQGRWSTERYFLVTRRFLNETRDYSVQRSQSSGRDDQSWSAEAHELRWGVKLDATFNTGTTDNDFTRRTTTERRAVQRTGRPDTTYTVVVPAGYTEHVRNRSLDVTLARPVGRTINLRLQGTVNLSTYRYDPVAGSGTSPVDRDQFRQNFLLDARFNPGKRWNTSVVYSQEVSQTVNLPAHYSASNGENRIYRLTWNWSYGLSDRLTASQRNAVAANYRRLTFRPADDDLTMEYTSTTTLEAIVVPNRLRVTVNHTALYQPSGDYVIDLTTGEDAFFKSAETKNYKLDARIAYSPSSWLTLNLNPAYLNDRRLSAQGEGLGLLSSTNNLQLSGGMSIRRRIGAKGELSGDLNRSFVADRKISYTAGLPFATPAVETDYWQGRLDFTWSY